MIHAAHGACFHWLESGNVLNHLRAQCLLATAYGKTGLTEAAIRHAQKCLTLSVAASEQQTAFDSATAHGCASAAYSAAGRKAEALAEYKWPSRPRPALMTRRTCTCSSGCIRPLNHSLLCTCPPCELSLSAVMAI